jgi:class 3 adenylate cyclase
MAVAGLPNPRPDHAHAAVSLAMDMLTAAERFRVCDGTSLQLRIGISSGPVIAGVIGRHKFAYDLWGDTVNTAARMESHGQPGRIQVTEATYRLVRDQFRFEPCGDVYIKGKGLMRTHFVARDEASCESNVRITDAIPLRPINLGSAGLTFPGEFLTT